MTRVLTPSSAFDLRTIPLGALTALGRVIGRFLDGVVVGLVVGYLALTAIGAPAAYLGIPDPLAILLVGAMAVAFALSGAGVAVGARRAFGWLRGRMLDRPWARRHTGLAAMLAVPFRIVAALPAGWLGAMAVLLWIALVGRTIGPIGLLTPPGVLSPYLYLAGLVAGVLGVAGHLANIPRTADRPTPGRLRRMGAGFTAVVAAVLTVGGAELAFAPGSPQGLVAYDPAFDGLPVQTALTDPGRPGPYAVRTLSYGSGSDGRRPAFGTEADLTTPSVDASTVLPALDGGADAVREWFWGFGTDALPLQGLAWLPEGDGPFPLVLIVHGNHAMGQYSEDGYAYLAEHLASRGLIAVSIDEDFLNGSWVGEWHGDEQLARAWLLLLHADLWRSWSADPASDLHGLVDSERIALVGHSRGGEASAIAASLASRKAPPRRGMAPWPTGLDIDAVIAIAPSDGQYTGSLRLEGVDFMTLSGGHDADARAWSGIRQFARTIPEDGGFKAAIWSYRANHGQFNRVWGRSDQGPFGGALLDLAPLLTVAEQEDVAKTAIGAFLAASLQGQHGYRGVFRRPMVGRDWFPDDIVLVRLVDGDVIPLTTTTAAPVEGLRIETSGTTDAPALPLPLRALQRDQVTRGQLVRWQAGAGDATWTISGLDRVVGTVAGDAVAVGLRLALADGRSDLGSGHGSLIPLAVTVEAIADGLPVALPLSTYGALPPPLPVRLVKHDLLASLSGMDLSLRSPAETVLQSYHIPLQDFAAADPAFDPGRLDAVTIRVPRTDAGGLWIAEVGLGGGGSTADPTGVP